MKKDLIKLCWNEKKINVPRLFRDNPEFGEEEQKELLLIMKKEARKLKTEHNSGFEINFNRKKINGVIKFLKTVDCSFLHVSDWNIMIFKNEKDKIEYKEYLDKYINSLGN